MKDSDYLKSIRTRLGITQTEMAGRMGYSFQNKISDIEQGKKQLSAIARKLLECIEKHELNGK